jgi:hypothetical protein
MKEPISEGTQQIVDALTSHIVSLQARCDALSIAVHLLAVKLGLPRSSVQRLLKTGYDTSLQKRLERIEDQSPLWASKIDQRESLGDIDPDLLKGLEFEDS